MTISVDCPSKAVQSVSTSVRTDGNNATIGSEVKVPGLVESTGNSVICSDIRNRAALGESTADDIRVLRTTCQR